LDRKNLRERVDTTERPGPIFSSKALASAARSATVGLFGLGALFALHEASSIVAPMFAAVVVGVVLSRFGDRAQSLGIPPFLAAAAFTTASAVAIVLAAAALTSRLGAFVDRAPELIARLYALLGGILRPLQILKIQIFGPAAEKASSAAPAFDMNAVTTVIGGLTPALGGFLIFVATLFFFIAGRADLRRKIVLAQGRRENRLAALRILNGVEDALAHYFGSAALVYGALATFTAVLAWVSGLGAPLLWGVFAFVACFVPFAGVTIVFVALLAAGFAVHDQWIAGLAPAFVYLVVHFAIDNAVLPAIVGRRFEVNPFLVFVSIVFWTWMWGAVGAVIAAPLLLIMKIVVEEFREEDAPELPD